MWVPHEAVSDSTERALDVLLWYEGVKWGCIDRHTSSRLDAHRARFASLGWAASSSVPSGCYFHLHTIPHSPHCPTFLTLTQGMSLVVEDGRRPTQEDEFKFRQSSQSLASSFYG